MVNSEEASLILWLHLAVSEESTIGDGNFVRMTHPDSPTQQVDLKRVQNPADVCPSSRHPVLISVQTPTLPEL